MPNTNFIEMSNLQFHRLYVLYRLPNNHRNNVMWRCICICGNFVDAPGTEIRNHHVGSCGCYNLDVVKAIKTTHGYAKKGQITSEYNTWRCLKARCYNENNEDYDLYGGRGIKVCDRWLESFENFIADMGNKPTPKHSIDRRDNEGDYTPDNCYWATPTEQANNKRSNVIFTYNGKTQSLIKWAEELGFPVVTLESRYYRGWDTERLLTTPRKGTQ